ncbi:endonuclease/exonuclease/phosphatase family protein [Kaistia nematophila]|uniref:Endonuclease/exonuclease/phosphatase family protein n=1 Tax=Kaistia nematophila TaxID=2994654 RepID=A0A9X3E5F5_9HYPH|nr:endonuclease/exonuclease/phosphatase family protein [Kaistia nematophila]MCX5571057.1 endonuclease/exonuclease/phosphatase family protein [Kaistia nematophila]
MTADDLAPSAAAELVTTVVPKLPVPSIAFREEAMRSPKTRAEHDRLALDLPAFNAVEIRGPAPVLRPDGPLRIAAWNAERLKYQKPSADLVAGVAPDVLLLSETDLGMARAGNRHTAGDLAAALGMGYAYGVEFLELGLGDDRERAWHAGETNAAGFHGNALLSRLPFGDVALIRLDDGAVWWLDAKDGEHRLGWRMAIAARVEAEQGPFWAVVVHLESKSDAADRARQMIRLLQAVDGLAQGLPVVIGGDLNTNALMGHSPADWLAGPQKHELLFAVMAEAGFDWQDGNTADATLRMRPDGTPLPPYCRIDWLLSRGLDASNARTVPALDKAGNAISDHDLVVADFAFR